MDKSYEGILGVQFVNRMTDTDFILYICIFVLSCYLPPENSTRRRDAQSFFAHLLADIYSISDSDYIFMGGDFNARIGHLFDTIYDCDQIPNRKVLDSVLNQHGQDFVEFLNEAKVCVLNGRFNEHDKLYVNNR